VEEMLARMQANLYDGQRLRQVIAAAVPTYRAPEEVNRCAENAKEMQMAH